MKRVFALVLSILSVTALFSQTVMKIAGKDVSKEEFLYYYGKNAVGDAAKLSVSEYTDLFIKFKLKVAEAYNQKMDTIGRYKNEIAGYREQLIKPYLTDDVTKDSLVLEAYNRLLEDLDVSHILFKVTNPADSLAAYTKAKDALKWLEVESFEQVAASVSEDKGSAQDSGRIGYMTSLMTVYPFESAAYNTKTGECSGIVRSGYGYHIIKVNARRPSRGQARVSHIFKRKYSDYTESQLDSLKNVVFGIYDKLKKGDSFEDLASKESDDPSSRRGGGFWTSTGRANEMFNDAAFAIKDIDGVSEPLEAPYGWHIIKLYDRKPIDSLSVIKPEIEARVKTDERARIIANSFIAKLRKYYSEQDALNGTSIAALPDDSLFEYEKNNLESRYPEFGMLMKEYRDGILMFDISQKEIWDKAAKDTVGLRKYFEANKAKYKYSEPRYKGIVVRCVSKDIKRKAQRMLGSVSLTAAYDKLLTLNTSDEKNVRLERGVFPEGKNAIVDHYIFGKGKLPYDSKYPESFVVGKIQKEYPDNYKDVRGPVLNDYQNEVEAEWIKRLRKKYPVEIYQEVLDTIK